MLAACYLSRRWPSKYFRLCRSLRLCSGWEQVVYLRLATKKLAYKTFSNYIRSCYRFRYTQNCTRYNIINLTFSFCVVFRHLPALLSQRCTVTSHRLTLFRKSPRPISNARLKMLPLLHLHPINVVIYNGTY